MVTLSELLFSIKISGRRNTTGVLSDELEAMVLLNCLSEKIPIINENSPKIIRINIIILPLSSGRVGLSVPNAADTTKPRDFYGFYF